MELEAYDFPKTEPNDFSKTEVHNFLKANESEGGSTSLMSMESILFKSEQKISCKKTELKGPKMEIQNFPKKEESEGGSTTLSLESICLRSDQKISCKIEKDYFSRTAAKRLMRIRDFISLLLSYPVRITAFSKFKDWVERPLMSLLCDEGLLRYVEGLVPMEIISKVENGERFIFNDDVIPLAILNLSADLAVDHLIQTLLSKHHDASNILKYIRLSTRSVIEKRAVMQKIEGALKDKHNMLQLHNSFHGTLMIDTSRYQSPVENQVRQYICQLLNTEYVTEDNDIFLTRCSEKKMSSKRYLVLLVDGDAEEKLDPWKVGFPEANLSGVVVLITTESSTQEKDKLIMEMDLEIRTQDHLLPWEVFCHNVGSKVVYSSSVIQSFAVHIVEECRGHLLSIVLVSKWLKNRQDVLLWELALHKIRYTNPSYDIHKLIGMSRSMINTFINFIWDGISKTQKYCLFRCLFIPKITFGMVDCELMDDWISFLLVCFEEAEHNLRELVDHSVLLQFEGIGGRYIRLPEETYEILQSLHTLNPMLIKKGGLGLTEPPNTELWHSAVKIDLANNKLSELPLSPNWLELTVLMLQGNADLTKIPPFFFIYMPLLRILDLSYTSLRELPSSLFNLEQLRELYLRGCERFMKLPPEIGKLQKLEKLDLDETQIIHLPKEIQELTNMQSLTLYFYEYHGKKNMPYSLAAIIPSGVISKLKGLKHLSIDVNPDDERWYENIQIILPEILGLECLQTLRLYVPQLELLKLIPARIILEVDFRFIVGCHKQRILSSIPPTVGGKFKQSECSLKFVKGVNVPSEIKKLLRKSKAFFLDRHMTIKNLSEFEIMNLEQLQVCILAECKEMQTIVNGRHSNSNSNNDMLSHLLFLSVSHMKNLRCIWEGPSPPPCCFLGMLQSLWLQSCPKLTTLFSLDFVGNLSLLKELIVKDCRKLSTLISNESSKLKVDIFLPKLSKLSLVHLPELISISNGLQIGPSLKEIGFYDCPKLQSLSRNELSSLNLTVIKGETDWWNELKWSKEWGKAGRPSKLNRIFFAINEEADMMTQLGIYNDEDIEEVPGGSVGEPSLRTASGMSKSLSLHARDFMVQKLKLKQRYIDSTDRPENLERIFPPINEEAGVLTQLATDDTKPSCCDEEIVSDAVIHMPHSIVDSSRQGTRLSFDFFKERHFILHSSQLTTGLGVCASPSGGSISSRKSPCAPECSLSSYSDQQQHSNITYGSPRSGLPSDDGGNELKHKLRELEISLLGPESDIVDHAYSCFRDDLHQASPTGKYNWVQIAEMIPRLDLRKVLILCAEAMSDNDFQTTIGWMENVLGKMVSVAGDPIQRLGAYLLEGLRARLESSGSLIYRALKCEQPTGKEQLSYMHILYQICPYWKFAYISANGTIGEAMQNESRIHIIDFQIAQGTQWMLLIQALARRPGGPPFLRVTGVDDSHSFHARGGGLHIVGERLSHYAKSCRVPFVFHSAAMSGCEVEPENLVVPPGEALAVNFPYVLHHMPDESVSTENHRDRLLRLVKSLFPKVVTLVEQESNTNTAPFIQRFVETLDYYTAMFESIDVARPRDDKQRISAEQHCVARDIVNIVACEGTERVERHELLEKWRLRFSMAGFTPCPLSSSVTAAVRNLLKEFNENYKLEPRDGALYLGWMNRALATSSAWR